MPGDTLMRAALSLAERGMAVFPLRPGTKRPAVRRDWEGCATRDTEQIERWWFRAPYNIGVATGPSKLVVVDLDAPRRASGDRHGRQALMDVAHDAGVEIPRQTFTVVTPGGGQHLYFRAPAGPPLTNTAGRLGPHVDTRATGGYIVGPGSKVSGRLYRQTCAAEPLPLPSWIEDRLRPRFVPSQAPSALRSSYVEAAVRNETRRVLEAQPGARNSVLFQAAASLGRFVPGGQLSESAIRCSLESAAASHVGTEGFTASEARRTISSGLRRGCVPDAGRTR